MEKTDKDILTTADTARLLGVSIRTAQLLIEGGSVPSWKTPGGHRRVYRADIMALIERRAQDETIPSATVVVVAPTERLSLYERLFADVAECTAEMFDDVHDALFAIGSARPYAIVVDLDETDPERRALLNSVASNPSLGHTRLLAVAARTLALPDRVLRLDAPDQAPAAIRASLADAGEVVVASDDLPFPIALNESQRLVALERSGLLDTAPEEAFDRLDLARRAQPRCAHRAAHPAHADPAVVQVALRPRPSRDPAQLGLLQSHDPAKGRLLGGEPGARSRFAANPAVKGQPLFRFYAGAPVIDNEGFTVGSLCVIDYKPRKLDEREAQTLMALAALASDEVRLRAIDRQLRETLRRAERQAPVRSGVAADPHKRGH